MRDREFKFGFGTFLVGIAFTLIGSFAYHHSWPIVGTVIGCLGVFLSFIGLVCIFG